jgi:hypothetical protein
LDKAAIKMSNYITFGKDQYHLQNEMQDWCIERFGQGSWINNRTPKNWEGLPAWTIHGMFGITTFSFKDPKHLTMFALKWA